MSTSSVVHSNAFGFMSFLNNSVDPRTGQYTLSVNFPTLKANALRGPSQSLALAFSPLNTRDSGFGKGWSLNLTQFTPASKMVTLSSGESFKVTGSGENADIHERKLNNFQFSFLGDNYYRVVHKSGLVEELKEYGTGVDAVALPYCIYAASGHAVHLDYIKTAFGISLDSIRDEQGQLLKINYVSHDIIQVDIAPGAGDDGGPKARYQLALTDRVVKTIVLPSEANASWELDYARVNDFLCLTEVKTPVGGRETIHYGDEGHAYPSGAGERKKLPRVTRHMTYPGAESDPGTLKVEYDYTGSGDQKGHNFLGAGAPMSWEPEGVDNLYFAPSDYTYTSTSHLVVSGSSGRTVTRTYNRFHLLILEETKQNNCIQTVSTTYYCDTGNFEGQPAQFQAPKKVETKWLLADDPTQSRVETVHTRFDEHGNPLQELKSNGITIDYSYYSADGEGDDCPSDPYNFVRNLKSQTVTPSGNYMLGACVLQTRYRYKALPVLTSSTQPPYLVIADERLMEVKGKDEIELQQTVRDWYNEPDNFLIHGQPEKQRSLINGLATESQFEYAPVMFDVKHDKGRTLVTVSDLDNNAVKGLRAHEFALQIKETLIGFDDGIMPVRQTNTRQYSPVNGLPLKVPDLAGTQVLFTYDSMDRLISETVAPGEDEEVSTHHAYFLSHAGGEYAKQVSTDAMGVKTYIQYDGLNRVVSEARLLPGDIIPAQQPRKTYTATWNAWGNLDKETDIDWLDERDLVLDRTYTYDDWGQQASQIESSNQKTVQQTTPTNKEGPIFTNWIESNSTPILICDLSVTQFNAHNKPTSITRLNTQTFNSNLQSLTPPPTDAEVRKALNTAILLGELPEEGTTVFNYDGLGNCLQQTLKLTGQDITNHYEYDSWGRQITAVLPDGSRVHRSYAEHSELELVTQIQVFSSDARAPSTVVGRQTYDGLLRLTQMRSGAQSAPRIEQYHYAENQIQVDSCTTPAGNTHKYIYNSLLTEQPIQIKVHEKHTADEVVTTFKYHPKTASIMGMNNAEGERIYAYDANNHLLEESWVDRNQITHKVDYITSLQGRSIQRSEGGVTTHTEYDEVGRILSTSQKNVIATFTYDTFGLLHTINTVANPDDPKSKSTLVTTIEYDTFRRETKRTFFLDQQSPYTLKLAWYEDNQLKRRTLESQDEILLDETYLYDPRGRLQEYQCDGSVDYHPKDRLGNVIKSQTFIFDELDNLNRCLSTFVTPSGERTDDAKFTYSSDDRFKLLNVTHTYTEGGYLASNAFEYDRDGNLLNDEVGQRLTYDSQGRLINVKDAAEDIVRSQYRYDGHNHLVSVTLENDSECMRFYQGFELSHTFQDNKYTHFLFSGGRPLSQQMDDHNQTLLLLSDASPSVIGESLNGQLHLINYSAYGERDKYAQLQSLLAFNAEVCEPLTGWYLLGRGYRAYNPGLMRFHSPDSLSPFGEGGVNPYAYCLGNPINFRDPTGHFSTGWSNLPLQYQPVQEQDGPSGFEKWLYVGLAALGVIATLIFMPVSAPMLAGLALQVVGLGLQIQGTASENGDLVAIGIALGTVGGLVSYMGAGKGVSMLAALKNSATKGAAGSSTRAATSSLSNASFKIPRATINPNAPATTSAGTQATTLKSATLVRTSSAASRSRGSLGSGGAGGGAGAGAGAGANSASSSGASASTSAAIAPKSPPPPPELPPFQLSNNGLTGQASITGQTTAGFGINGLTPKDPKTVKEYIVYFNNLYAKRVV